MSLLRSEQPDCLQTVNAQQGIEESLKNSQVCEKNS